MTTLADLGEREIIKRLVKNIRSDAVVGPGDDAAAVDIGDSYLVISTDLITKADHVPDGMSSWQIGWTVAAVNYSDIAAMGAKPIGMVAAFALPPDMAFKNLEEIMRGIQDCSTFVGGGVLGGDTKESSELMITGTAIGVVRKDQILLRRGARPGNLLAVTGKIGMAAAGYISLKDGPVSRSLVRSLLEPIPKVKEGMALASTGAVTSCMDITDGLAFSVHQLSEASNVSFKIDLHAIPTDKEVISVSETHDEKLEDLLLYFGGDYELLFSFRPDAMIKIKEALGNDFAVIGQASAGGENVLIKNGRTTPLLNKGYEHFRRKK